MDPRRIALLDAARKLLGTDYNDGAPTTSGRPSFIDCSGVVAWACREVFNADGRLVDGRANMIQARIMFDNLRETTAPLPADLAFYVNAEGAMHVMMVTERRGLIGACPHREVVAEYDPSEYTPETYAPALWTFQGFKSFPLVWPFVE